MLALAVTGCTAPAAAPLAPTGTAMTGATALATPTVTIATETPTAKATLAMTPTATPVGNATARLNERFELPLGQSVTLADANNVRVSFTGVLQDTRCPQDVNCFQAGSVRVAVTIESGGKLARFDLSSWPPDYRSVGAFDGYLVQFLDLAPTRISVNSPIPPADYRVALRLSEGSLQASPARFNAPFTLRPGQSTEFEGSKLRLTFQAVKQDSRCPASVNCVTNGTATVAVELVYDSANREQIILGVDGTPVMASYPIASKTAGYVRANALTPYPQAESASTEIAPNDYEAIFVVGNPVAGLVTATPSPLASCPDLPRADASEILGEAVREQPAAMILFQPPDKSISVRGLCGYGSVAYTPNKTTPPQLPRVLPATDQSDHAVIAGKLTDNRRLEQLLSIVSAIDAANPKSNRSLYYRLVTYSYAGAWSRDILGDFPDAARGATDVRVSKVGSLGENAIWVWREFDGGHYAALVALKAETLFVMEALTSPERTEDDLLTVMTSAVQKMLQ